MKSHRMEELSGLLFDSLWLQIILPPEVFAYFLFQWFTVYTPVDLLHIDGHFPSLLP